VLLDLPLDHYNTLEPRSLVGYISPVPAVRLTQAFQQIEDLEGKERLPLSRASNYGDEAYRSPAAPH